MSRDLRKIQMMRFLLSLGFVFLFFISAFSQTITLNGRVIDQKNIPIPGATIEVTGGVPVSSNVEGRFSLLLTKGKSYTLQVSAQGFSSKSVSEISVNDNNDNNIEIVLEIQSKSMEGIVIRATNRRQENTMALLNFQKNNTSLSSGIAADFIRRTPDRNTGEVLKRVSGISIQDNKYVVVRGLSDRYNQAMLNDALMPSSEPDKKAFSFDIIPSVMIDNIVVNKTATPDMIGEFAGGLVQINTKDIPSKNFLSVGFVLGFNTQSTFKDFTSNPRGSLDWLGFDDGGRNLPKGLPSTVRYRELTDAQKIDATLTFKGDVYGEVVKKAMPITTLNVTWGNNTKFKDGSNFGTIVSLFYRRAQIIFDNVERGRFEQVRTPIFEGTEVQNRYSANTGILANFTYVKGKHKISFKNLFNQLYEDNYYNRDLDNIGRLQKVSLRSSFLNQRSLYSGQLEGDHIVSKSGIRFKWNGNLAYNYKTQPDFRTAQFVASNTGGQVAEFELDDDDTRRFFSTLKDYTLGANGFFSIPFLMGTDKQLFKVGGGTIVRLRDFNARVFRYRPASPATDITIPFDLAFLPNNINKDGLFLDEQTQNTDVYQASSALNSVYGMFDNKIGDNLRIVWGLRAEFFEQLLTTRDLTTQRVVINTEKWDFLPSINMTYSFDAKKQIRLSGSRTVSRPEFREIAPFQFFDYEQIWGVSGNVDLKRTSILNGDLRFEYYPKAGEVLSVGLLVKDFTNPIELRMDPGSNGDRWLFNYANADQAFLYGAELDIRKSFDFINEKWADLIFIANLTYLESTVTLTTQQSSGDKSQLDRPLFGQSPYLINAGFQYSRKGWNVTALYNRIGPRLALVGDPVGAGFFDIYERPRNLIDIQIAKRVLDDKAELKFWVNDLLNNKFAFYDNPTKNASFDFNGGDRVNYAYSPGTTLAIGFIYDFDLSNKK